MMNKHTNNDSGQAVATAESIKIMLVEDNPYDYQSFRYAFEEYAVEICWCETSEQAWKVLTNKPDYFDLIVCDYNLPMMTGLELSKKILQHQLSVPIVLLTGSGNEDIAVEALKSGVDDYLVKDVKGHYLNSIPRVLNKTIYQFNTRLENKKNEDQLAIAAKVFSNTTEAIIITDADNLIENVNQAFCHITGYSYDDVIGKNPRMFSSGRQNKTFYLSMWAELEEKGSWQGEIWNRKKNGEIYPEWLTINTIYDSTGEVLHYIGVFTDISSLKETERKLYEYAYYDSLTQLPNRASFLDRLKQEIIRNNRDKFSMAVMFIDLDHFKWINDTLGHLVGDSYLQIVANRLMESIRKSDTVARFAGDEFVTILPGIKSSNDVAVIAEKILLRFSDPFYIGDQELSISASIGVAMCPADGKDSDTLIRHADAAMYQSKNSGRNTYHFFTKDMQESIKARLCRVAELQKAINEQQFEMYYQPFIDFKTGKIIGAEALVRWQNPIRGLLGPGQFIPLAEETGLIIPLGYLILELVCKQVRLWQIAGYQLSEIAINLSKLQFKKVDFLSELTEIVKRTEVDTSILTLEITESLMMDEQDKVIEILEAIKAIDFKLSLDDFGTGYSSLSQLKDFPFDYLKIPRPFVHDVVADQHSAALAKAIINMGHSLNLKVVAEGVETEQQLQVLKQHDCDLAQGYLFSKAINVEEITALFSKAF